MKHRFPIGLVVTIKRPKRSTVITITDRLTVTNDKGEVVRCYYETQHSYLGQIVTNHEVADTTIARALGSEGIKPYLY